MVEIRFLQAKGGCREHQDLKDRQAVRAILDRELLPSILLDQEGHVLHLPICSEEVCEPRMVRSCSVQVQCMLQVVQRGIR